jgi:hypothetical protein
MQPPYGDKKESTLSTGRAQHATEDEVSCNKMQRTSTVTTNRYCQRAHGPATAGCSAFDYGFVHTKWRTT